MPRPIPALVLIAAVAAATLAHAQRPDVEVPPNCGSERALRSRLTGLVGTEALSSVMPRRLHIAATGEGYRLELAVGDTTRVLSDSDCAALFRSAVVMAAATLPPRGSGAVPSTPVPALTSEPREAAEPVAGEEPPELEPVAVADQSRRDAEPPGRSEGPTPEQPLRVQLATGVGVDAGLLPDPALTLELALSLAVGRLGGLVALRYAPARSAELEGQERADLWVLGGRAAIGYLPWPFLRLSLGPELSRMQGSSLAAGVDDSKGTWLFGFFAEAAPRAELWGPLSAELALAVRYAVSRPTFELTGGGRLHRTPALGAGASLRLGFAFD